MTPETLRQYRDDIARCRHERDAYKARAAARWKDYIELRKKKRWLAANEALDRHHEYKRTAAQYASEVVRLQQFVAA